MNYNNNKKWGPGDPEWEKAKKCRIVGCTYKVSPYFEKLGVCGVHTKKCQGVVPGKWERTSEGVKWRFQKVQCDIAVPIDGGDFCEGCKDQTETYQQWKARTESEDKQVFERWCRVKDKAQSWWSTISPQEKERECERLAQKIVKEGRYTASGWVHTGSFWGIENGKFTSSNPNLVPIEIIQEFAEKEVGLRDNKMIEYFESQMVVKKNDSGYLQATNNPPSPNQSSQPKNNHDQPPKVNANSTNQQPPEIGQELTENKESEKKRVEIIKDKKESNSNRNDNEVLIVDLKNVKKITLRGDGKLEIEFKSVNHSISQVVNDEQINNNQELQKIKNYCQQHGKSSLNQQELNSIINPNSNTSTSTSGKLKDSDSTLGIGLAVATAALAIGLVISVLLKRKKGSKKVS